jgi:hypothetical protein
MRSFRPSPEPQLPFLGSPAAIKQLVNRAATGEARATALLIQLAQANEAKANQPDTERVAEADTIVMAELQRRLKRQA